MGLWAHLWGCCGMSWCTYGDSQVIANEGNSEMYDIDEFIAHFGLSRYRLEGLRGALQTLHVTKAACQASCQNPHTRLQPGQQPQLWRVNPFHWPRLRMFSLSR